MLLSQKLYQVVKQTRALKWLLMMQAWFSGIRSRRRFTIWTISIIWIEITFLRLSGATPQMEANKGQTGSSLWIIHLQDSSHGTHWDISILVNEVFLPRETESAKPCSWEQGWDWRKKKIRCSLLISMVMLLIVVYHHITLKGICAHCIPEALFFQKNKNHLLLSMVLLACRSYLFIFPWIQYPYKPFKYS